MEDDVELNTFLKWLVKAASEAVAGPLDSQIDLAHCIARPESNEMIYAILPFSGVNSLGLHLEL